MSKYIKLEEAIHNINLEVTGRKEYTGDMKANLFFALDDLPTIEVSEDCISREYLKSLGYINKGDFNSVETIREWIDNAPSVVPKRAEGEPQTENIKVTCDMVGSKNEIEYQLPKCEKCINYGVEFTEDDSIDTCLIDECHYEPKDEQSSKVGEWQITDAYPHNVYCSECHKKFAQTHWAVWEDGSLPRNYCPNCGAKMKG